MASLEEHPGPHLTESIQFFGISFDFVLFALTLLGIALFHRHTLPIALAGLGIITAYKLSFTGFKDGAGMLGLGLHLGHEFSLLANLFLLLMGFALRQCLIVATSVKPSTANATERLSKLCPLYPQKRTFAVH